MSNAEWLKLEETQYFVLERTTLGGQTRIYTLHRRGGPRDFALITVSHTDAAIQNDGDIDLTVVDSNQRETTLRPRQREVFSKETLKGGFAIAIKAWSQIARFIFPD